MIRMVTNIVTRKLYGLRPLVFHLSYSTEIQANPDRLVFRGDRCDFVYFGFVLKSDGSSL